MRISALIIDDEENMRIALLEKLRSNHPDIMVVGTAGDINTAEKLIHSLQPQLLFLDIVLAAHQGFELIDRFPNPFFQVIFVTAYSNSEFAINALKRSAIDYVMKPIDDKELATAIERANERISQKNPTEHLVVLQNNRKEENLKKQKIHLSSFNGTYLVALEDIEYIQTTHTSGMLCVHVYQHPKSPVIITGNLGNFEQMLSDCAFFCRIHNSHIVNVNYIERYDLKNRMEVTMKDGTNLEVARRRKTDLEAAFESL
ncbi:MAG: LytR/AlgR family response regulator transcription factor [Bacteroidia bacterium]